MNFISQTLSKINFKLFHCWLNLFAFHSPGVSQQFWCSFSSSFSTIEDRKRISLKFCPFSRRFAVLARWLSYQIVTSRAIIFTHPEYFRSCFPSQLSGGLHFRIFLRSKFSNPFSDYSIFMPFRSSPYSSGVLLFNQFAISSFSCL